MKNLLLGKIIHIILTIIEFLIRDYIKFFLLIGNHL